MYYICLSKNVLSFRSKILRIICLFEIIGISSGLGREGDIDALNGRTSLPCYYVEKRQLRTVSTEGNA